MRSVLSSTSLRWAQPAHHHQWSEHAQNNAPSTPRHIAHARRGPRVPKQEQPLDVYEQQQKAAAEWAEGFFEQYHVNEDAPQEQKPAKIVFADMYTGDAPPDVISTTTNHRATRTKKNTASSYKTDVTVVVDAPSSSSTKDDRRTRERVASHKQASTSSNGTRGDRPTASKRGGVRRGRTLEAEEEEQMQQRDGKKDPRKSDRGSDGETPPGRRRAILSREEANTSKAEDAQFFSRAGFARLGVTPPLIAALGAVGIERPSHVQAKALDAYATDARYVVLADAAGSGKTLAYVIPIVQQLHMQEQAAGARITTPNAPRAVLLVPTEELALQLLEVCRSISANLPFRVVAVTGRGKRRTQKQFLSEGVDVLVATPGRLIQLLSEGMVTLDRCNAVVLDEVDVLLGATADFVQQVAPIQAATGPSTRFLFVTATLPEQIWLDLQLQFPGIQLAAGPRLHRHAPGLEAELIDCSGGDEISEESGFQRKAAALYAVMQEKRAARTIVFCNKIETCRKVENFLTRRHRKDDAFVVLPYHSAIADDARVANLKRFLKPPRDDGDQSVLVCTDRASRGMDSTHVEHVVLFDWPRDPSEYVRRVGRTARGAGGSGAVSILVIGRQVAFAKDVLSRVQKGQPVHRIPET